MILITGAPGHIGAELVKRLVSKRTPIRIITRDEQTKDIPVILCTSKNQETDKIWGVRQGAKDYIFKPVDEKDLLKKITSLR